MEKLFCKKCERELLGKQKSYCSEKCSRRHLKLLWQLRNREEVNKTREEWRKRTGRESDRQSYYRNKK